MSLVQGAECCGDFPEKHFSASSVHHLETSGEGWTQHVLKRAGSRDGFLERRGKSLPTSLGSQHPFLHLLEAQRDVCIPVWCIRVWCDVCTRVMGVCLWCVFVCYAHGAYAVYYVLCTHCVCVPGSWRDGWAGTWSGRAESDLGEATVRWPPHPGFSPVAARGSITARPLTCDPRCLVAVPTHLAAMLIWGAPLSPGRVAVTAQGHRGPPQRGHVKDPRPLLWPHRESWPRSQPRRDGPTWVSNLLEGAASPTQTEKPF